MDDVTEYGNMQGIVDTKSINKYVTQDGNLTETFKRELTKVARDEAQLFDDKIVGARPADQDLFGIKRRFCSV